MSRSIGSLADEVGLTQRDVANSLLVTLSGSGQVKPNFWLNTKNGVSYPIVAQMPQYRIDTMSDLVNVPITVVEDGTPQYLGGLARISAGPSAGVVSHYNVQPVIDIYGAIQERDLGAVACDIDRILEETDKDVPHGSYVVLRGQVQTMTSAYNQLLFGLIGAIVLDLSGDRRQLPVLARPVHYHHGAARGARRHRLDAVHDRNDAVGSGPDRRHHVHGHRHGEQRFAGQLRTRRPGRRSRFRNRRARSRVSRACVRC